jgi:hypothetical protein
MRPATLSVEQGFARLAEESASKPKPPDVMETK